MSLKYEIWVSTGDRYDLDSYINLREVFPFTGVSVDRKVDNIIEETLSSITFRDYENQLDFTYFKETREFEEGGFYYSRIIKVFRDCSGVWEQRGIAYLDIHSGEWDEDRCTVTFTPEPVGSYSCITDNWEVEKNILRITDRIDSNVNIYSTYSFRSILTDDQTPPDEDIGWWNTYSAISITNNGTFRVWIQVRNISTISIVDWIEVTENGSTFWYKNTQTTIPESNFISNNECDGLNPIKPAGDYTNLYTGCGSSNEYKNIWLLTEVYTSKALAGSATIPNGRLLTDVLQYLLGDCEYQFFSQMLQNTTNPLTGAFINPLKYLTIHQNSDVKYPDSTEQATILNMSLKSLLANLKIMLDLDWIIIENAFINFHLEHRKYFENGLSYTNPQIVGLDATTLINEKSGVRYIEGTNKYNISKANVVKYESFTWENANSENFIGVNMEYIAPPALKDIKENSVSLMTDLPYILNTPDAVSSEGYTMFQNNLVAGIYTVGEEVGLLNPSNLPNNHLSWANLQPKYLTYGRPTPRGYINNSPDNPTTEVIFDSTSKQKTQTITIPICCDTLEMRELITTDLGNGEIVSTSEDLKTGMITITLKYA